MSFLSVIGKRFGDAGLRDIAIESGLVAEGSINGVLSGHHYNRSINTMKVMYEAMERLHFSSFLDSLNDEEFEYFDSAITVKDEYPESQEFVGLFDKYQHFCLMTRKEDPTFELWSSFLDMMSLLLVFVSATRESDWSVHVAVLRLMMPWYFAYDRTNCSRYLPAYWMEMVNLPVSHPSVYHELSQVGAWTVQRHSNHAFASIACDQSIEETLNRDCKTPGGIKGITLNRGAVQRWILAQPERAAISRECEVMAGYHKVERASKELDQTHIRKLEESIMSVIYTVKSMINPFENTTGELVAISSGAVAIDAVKDDLLKAEAKGESAAMEFIKERLLVDGLEESLEEFVCHLYGHPSNDINHLRYKLFCSLSTSEQSLPPCKNALIQHSRRANYQAAIHRKALTSCILAPPPDGHGWAINDGVLSIVWMTQPSAPDTLLVSVSCSCKVSKCLQGRCSCRKQDLVCTDLCKCKNCENGDIITDEEVEVGSDCSDDYMDDID
jgi:hypothetical protein